jgi:hypothetical protein
MALGYAPDGTFGLTRANAIYWSGKAGNASAYTTAADEERWIDQLFHGDRLSAASRQAVLDPSVRIGYGWFKGPDKRFGETVYYTNGRAPGFASFALHIPGSRTTVVVLSNVYASATTAIGYDVAALALGLPYEPFRIQEPAPGAAELKKCEGTFAFGSDFYQPNAALTAVAEGRELRLRWPSGELTSLIPMGRDRFMDRSYWVEVRFERDAAGSPVLLVYDKFRGAVSGRLGGG